jgi:2-polyprenyl-3-methyl-5-hydroxy-6-metoxy-1,4-benzoquinol methylase
MHQTGGHYDANYGNFHTDLYARVRRQAFDEDIGQNSWLGAREQDRLLPLLNLSRGSKLLDIACGAGGPALRIATQTGCSVLGVDVHSSAIEAAAALAVTHRLRGTAEFLVGNAAEPLLLPDSSFEAITCIDAINHVPDRIQLLSECARLLKPNGRLLFTDPCVVTGPLTNEEIAVRTYVGFYLLTPLGYNEEVLRNSGFVVITAENATQQMFLSANRRKSARATYEAELRAVEGSSQYEAQQNFLTMVARLAEECRLSRFVFIAAKPGVEGESESASSEQGR